MELRNKKWLQAEACNHLILLNFLGGGQFTTELRAIGASE